LSFSTGGKRLPSIELAVKGYGVTLKLSVNGWLDPNSPVNKRLGPIFTIFENEITFYDVIFEKKNTIFVHKIDRDPPSLGLVWIKKYYDVFYSIK
jgi:hypothetical protein